MLYHAASELNTGVKPRPLPPDALAAIPTIAGVCAVLRGWGRPDLADRIAYFASDADLDDGDVPVTLDSALGFLALFGSVDADGHLELACTPEGWLCAEWYFDDARIATIILPNRDRVMFAARRADGRFTDFGMGGESGDRKTVTANMVAAGILQWHKVNQATASYRAATA